MTILQLEKTIGEIAEEMGFKVSITEKFKNDGYLFCKLYYIKTGDIRCLSLAIEEPTERFKLDLRHYLDSFQKECL